MNHHKMSAAVVYMRKHCRASSIRLDVKNGFRNGLIQRLFGLTDEEYDKAAEAFVSA